MGKAKKSLVWTLPGHFKLAVSIKFLRLWSFAEEESRRGRETRMRLFLITFVTVLGNSYVLQTYRHYREWWRFSLWRQPCRCYLYLFWTQHVSRMNSWFVLLSIQYCPCVAKKLFFVAGHEGTMYFMHGALNNFQRVYNMIYILEQNMNFHKFQNKSLYIR